MKNIKFHTDRGDLHKLCESINERESLLEIGSLAGVSTEIFSKYFKNVISIDPYIPGYDENDINSQEYRLKEAKKIFDKRFKNSKNVIQYNFTSEQAAQKFDGYMFDVVYIDSTHTYEAVKHDIELWSNKCKYLAGHDWDWADVNKAVKECFNENEIEIYKPNHWIVKI